MGEGYHSTLEWGFWKFIKYLATIGVVSWIVSWLLTRYANLDVIVWNWLVAVHLANLWLFIPETVTIIGVILIVRWSRKSENRNKHKQFIKNLSKI